MCLNYDNCEIMHIYYGRTKETFDFLLGGISLSFTKSYKYLGVHIHDSLKWDKHIEQTVNIGKRTLIVVENVLRKSPPNVKKLAYFSLVRPCSNMLARFGIQTKLGKFIASR